MTRNLKLLLSFWFTSVVILFLTACSDGFYDLIFEFIVSELFHVVVDLILTRWPAQEILRIIIDVKDDWICLPASQSFQDISLS